MANVSYIHYMEGFSEVKYEQKDMEMKPNLLSQLQEWEMHVVGWMCLASQTWAIIIRLLNYHLDEIIQCYGWDWLKVSPFKQTMF